MNCCGNCNQGRKPCPTPIACEAEEPDELRTARGILETVAWVSLAYAIIAFIVVLAV